MGVLFGSARHGPGREAAADARALCQIVGAESGATQKAFDGGGEGFSERAGFVESEFLIWQCLTVVD